MPVVQPSLISSIGRQMEDESYIGNIEQELQLENPYLADVCYKSMDSLNKFLAKDSEALLIANIIGRTVYLMMYNAIKQQMICDELKNG